MLLSIAPRQIEHLELWESQIWVKVLGARSVFVSYRRLPLWIESGTEAIQHCDDRAALETLGEVLRTEIASYSTHYSSATLEQWRLTWKHRAEQLKVTALRRAREQERLRPLRERQRTYQHWRESWQKVLEYCGSFESLERLAPEIELQSQAFDEFQGSQAAMQIWHQRWQELAQATA